MPTLPERLLLVSLDDDGQPRDPKSSLASALAGAAVTELLLAGRLALGDDRLAVADASPTGDPVLDEVLRQVEAEERLLGLIPVTRHPPAEPTADDQAREEVRAVLVGGRDPDEPTAALVEVTGLVDACVDRSERRQARQRARQIAAGDQVGEAVRRIQQEVMAAITVAVAAATTTAVTSGGDGGGS